MAGIFINYRRDDAPGVAGRLFDRLSKNFSQSEMFIDVDTMKPGLDFVKQLDEQVSRCDVVLAVIGPSWLNAKDEKGRRKLDLQRDPVRIELSSALKREIPVIPVLVNGTAMPAEDDLPDDLKSLANRHSRFAADSEAVIRALNGILPNRNRRRHLIAVAAAAALCLLGGALLMHLIDAQPDSQQNKRTQTAGPIASSSAQVRPERPAAPVALQPDAISGAIVTSIPFPRTPSGTQASPPSAGAARIALVIGNSRYPDADAPLKTPINDARLIGGGLKSAGFDVVVGENLAGTAMRQLLDQFYGRIQAHSVALLFFSGYGVQSLRQTYLIPVDAQIWVEADIRRDGFRLEAILEEIHGRGADIKIVLIDASRRNPFERRFRISSAGLAPVDAPIRTLVMYSGATSSVQEDSTSENSLFVLELLKNVGIPDLKAEEALNRARIAITTATRYGQVPWVSSSLAENFTLSPGSETPH
jgi:hypothetical protein